MSDSANRPHAGGPQNRGKRAAGQPASAPRWRWLDERGLLVDCGSATLARYAQLRALDLPEIEDLIPADGTLLIRFSVGARIPDEVFAALSRSAPPPDADTSRLHCIPVVYDGEDLAELAQRAGCSVSEWIRRHSAVEYTVGFVGFQPGFAYLFGLPEALAAPRLATPRSRVPAGSVAVGGSYCGVYPAAGPGGWRLVGRTTHVLFDPDRSPPALLAPGDRVRFEAR